MFSSGSRLLLVFALPLLTGGCIAKTMIDVVTLPVKAASQGVDMATTSQSEADEKRGRAMRSREEELGRLVCERDRLARRCDDGDNSACDRLNDVNNAIYRIESANY